MARAKLDRADGGARDDGGAPEGGAPEALRSSEAHSAQRREWSAFSRAVGSFERRLGADGETAGAGLSFSFVEGELVRVCADYKRVMRLQMHHGGVNERMVPYCGQLAAVKTTDRDGDVRAWRRTCRRTR